MISCSEAVHRLWEYLDGTLDGPQTERVEAHLARCRRCCGEMEFAHELRGLLVAGRDVPLPEESLRRLERTLEQLEGSEHGTRPDAHRGDPGAGP